MAKKITSMTTDQSIEERKKIYAATRQDLLIRNLSNSEKYDNAILTLSTGALGISLAFIKNIVPIAESQYISLLKTSWWLLGAAIVSTLVSFVLSQLAIKRQLELAEEYYLKGNDDAIEKNNCPALLTEFANYISGILFIVGIVTTICFVSLNINGGYTMSKNTEQQLKGGAIMPTLQKLQAVAEKKGATIPNMQPVKPSTSTTQQSVSQSGGNTAKTKK